VNKPDYIFDRDFEWRHLSALLDGTPGRPKLGVVSGRRRMGKTFLLEALTRASGGFYFGATEATGTESLRLFSDAMTAYLDAVTPLRFATWDEVITYLFQRHEQEAALSSSMSSPT
jgi:AAA+ ATPase superfamily predicted ATPase